MIVYKLISRNPFLIFFLALAFNSIALAEIGLTDIATEAAKSELGNPADAVPGVPSVSESVVESVAGDSAPSLVDSLTSSLGITPAQAEGGAGSLFQVAKQKLGADSFQSIADVVPNMDGLLGAAPKTEAAGGLLGGLGGLGGDSAGGVMEAASLVNDFQQLGLSSDMVGKFVPVVVDYVKTQGGETVANLLAGALTGL